MNRGRWDFWVLCAPTKPAPTKQMFLTGGAEDSVTMVVASDRVCRATPSTCSGLRSGDSPRELGGDVTGVASPDPQTSKDEDRLVTSESGLTPRSRAGMVIAAGIVAMMQTGSTKSCEKPERH